ncbi:MAG: signal recognition particle-docking protein FtsY [Bacillota bacterium]
MGLFDKFKQGLKKTKDNLFSAVSSIFTGKIDDEFYEELEFALISADVSPQTSMDMIDMLKDKVKENKITDLDGVRIALREIITQLLEECNTLEIQTPCVIMMVGVNGVGKTTTIGKLTNYFKSQKKEVVLVAADTFRAAAAEQLTVWAERSKVRIIKQSAGADPAAVVFDGVSSAKSKGTDILLVDTAGRLHNKVNLMQELEKMERVVAREYPEAHFYKFMVLDAVTGQNAVNQVEAFNEAVDIDGIVLTKLDGTAKGGVAITIAKDKEMPICFIGLGEQIDDLQEFDAKSFAEAII